MSEKPKLPHTFCKQCLLHPVYLSKTLPHDNRTAPETTAVGKLHILQPKEHLFRKEDKFHILFTICSGSLKSYLTDIEGREKVIGFHFPGEILGINAIHSGIYPHNAMALETTHICAVSFEQVFSLSTEIPTLQRRLIQILSRKISDHPFYLGNYGAEERLAGFLLYLSHHSKGRGDSGSHFVLSMDRRDIANHLGMAIETVSRLLTNLQKKGILKIKNRQLAIIAPERLRELARCLTGR
ncbi:MAG: helix-turn-helix domain-containing protein [Gammaproteobacteria bacterium]|nr:helix-turn-helix domain-containing protein [Gammaproteobacteria bacterium]